MHIFPIFTYTENSTQKFSESQMHYYRELRKLLFLKAVLNRFFAK